MRIANRNLEKQSQFLKGRNDVKSAMTMSYRDIDGPGQRKNKPNSKPNKANFKLSDRIRAWNSRENAYNASSTCKMLDI